MKRIVEKKEELAVFESVPEYWASKDEMQKVKKKIKELETKIEKLEK